jgi:hypothetical protein
MQAVRVPAACFLGDLIGPTAGSLSPALWKGVSEAELGYLEK